MEKKRTNRTTKKVVTEKSSRQISKKVETAETNNIKNKDLELLKKINIQKNELQEFENLVNDVDENPQLILGNLFPNNKQYNELFNLADTELYNIQEFFYEKLKKYLLFDNKHIVFDYQKDVFPANITILYDNIPVFVLDLINKEYCYVLSETIKKEQIMIEQAEDAIDACTKRGTHLVPIKSFITNDYDELKHCFKTMGLAREKFFEFYLENKKYNGLLDYLRTKLSFYFHFKDNQSKYIDDILKVYDQVNETIEKYDVKKKACMQNINTIQDKKEEIGIFSRQLIMLLIENQYNIK